jgi:outer membrane protein assembly factor BamB
VYVNQGQRVTAYNRFTEREVWNWPADAPPGAGRAADAGARGIGLAGAAGRDGQEAFDLNIVAVASGALVTVMGHAQSARRWPSGEVVCLDPLTGALRWKVDVGSLEGRRGDRGDALTGQELRGLFVHGWPVLADGRVYLMARRVSSQLVASAYVLALELEGGELAWVRHIVSTGGIRASPGRSFSALVHDRGELLIVTSLGAMARLDATTGVPEWVVRFNAPLNPGGLDARPWEVESAVVIKAESGKAEGGSSPLSALSAVWDGTVVALQPDGRRVVALDRKSGQPVASHPLGRGGGGEEARAGWGQPRYLLADEERVYAVSRRSVRAFDRRSLQEPVWVLGEARVEAGKVEEKGSDPFFSTLELRGRVQLAGGHLVVPEAGGILIVRAEDGAVVNRLARSPAPGGGNPVLAGGQLIVATDGRLDVYMPLARAERMLRERLAARGGADAEPALALMRLGMRARDFGRAMEAAGLAWQAIANAKAESGKMGSDPLNERGSDPFFPLALSDAQAELFEMLLAMDRHPGLGGSATLEQGQSLHAMIGQVAVTPAQRVLRHLAHGDWLVRRNSLAEAVEAWQTVLSDRELAEAMVQRLGSEKGSDPFSIRRGAAWARARLVELAARAGGRVAGGSGIYRPQSEYAAMRLAAIRKGHSAQKGSDPISAAGAMLALAREFPLAECAVEAAVEAGRVQAASARWREALEALNEALSLVEIRKADTPGGKKGSDPFSRSGVVPEAEIYGLMLEVCVSQSLEKHARGVMRHAAAAGVKVTGPVWAPPGAGPAGEWWRARRPSLGGGCGGGDDGVAGDE